MLDALFVSPHPDDAELFCGGTIAALVAAGRRVAIVDLTRGEKASNGSPELRREESLCAQAALGLEGERSVLGLPDGGLDADDPRQAVRLARTLRRLRPRVVFHPTAQDRHPDHVAAHGLTELAVTLAATEDFMAPEDPFRVQRTWAYPCHGVVDDGVLVDVGRTLGRWREAVACYASQFRRTPDAVPTPINEPGFLESQVARRERWGQRVGVEAAELFVGEKRGLVDVESLVNGIGDDGGVAGP